jgi:hypothetical protein
MDVRARLKYNAARRKTTLRRHPYRVIALILLAAAVAVLAAACSAGGDGRLRSPVPQETAEPDEEDLPVPTAEPGATPVPVPTRRPVRPTATIPVLPPPEDDDCSSCKREPEVYTPAPAGKQQPPSHAGRTACLSCHKTQPQPPLPATHANLADDTCTMCHIAPPKARQFPGWSGKAALVRVHLRG